MKNFDYSKKIFSDIQHIKREEQEILKSFASNETPPGLNRAKRRRAKKLKKRGLL